MISIRAFAYTLDEVLVRFIRQLLLAAMVALAVSTLQSLPAGAHTGFDSSDPADGATVEGEIEVVTLEFTGEAEPTGSGFEALDASGELRTPSEATTEDGTTWVLRFAPPLGEGVVGVRWNVKAPDAHPIEGSFSFTVTALTPAAEATTPTNTAPALEIESEAAAPAGLDLDDFLATDGDSTSLARRVGAAARLVTLAGTMLGVGALIFAAAVLRGERRDVRQVLFWVRRAGLLVVVGVVGELAAQVAVESGGDWSALWSLSAVRDVMASAFGVAVALRLVGGTALAAGVRLDVSPADQVRDPVAVVGELVGVGASGPTSAALPAGGDLPDGSTSIGPLPGDQAWQPITSTSAVAGAAALVAAHLFDGHTLVKGHRFWTGLADVIHVLAGAVWVGGIAMLAAVLWRRYRDGLRPRALHLGLRFSVVATVALVAVGLAGLALTVIVLDSPSELWSTGWGRTLLVKLMLVVLAAVPGAYNHRVLLPELGADPGDPALAARFRAIVTFEAVVLAAVVAATAVLMGAAS